MVRCQERRVAVSFERIATFLYLANSNMRLTIVVKLEKTTVAVDFRWVGSVMRDEKLEFVVC